MNLYDKIGILMDAAAELGTVKLVHATEDTVEVYGKTKNGESFVLKLEVE